MHECKECGHQWPRSTVISVKQDGKYVTGRECPKCGAFVPSPPRGNVYKRRIADLERKLEIATGVLKEIACVAHHGGLKQYKDETVALNFIRYKTLPWWDKNNCNDLQEKSRND